MPPFPQSGVIEMSEWKQKRFWNDATITQENGGWSVKLDGRTVKTPAKAGLILPTKTMAQAVAAEWHAQKDEINPLSMPFTRSANAAIDKVRIQRAEVADMLAAYGDADLVCYRADSPDTLVARQAAEWNPFLDWAADRFGARLLPRTGILHESQDAYALALLSDEVHMLSDFSLAAFHDLVGLTGSLILGFAAAKDAFPLPRIWAASRLDELWQEEQWGVDQGAQEAAGIKESAFFHAKAFYDASAVI